MKQNKKQIEKYTMPQDKTQSLSSNTQLHPKIEPFSVKICTENQDGKPSQYI